MGASQFTRIGTGRDIAKAFDAAYRDAGYEYGHLYSGDLSNKSGYDFFGRRTETQIRRIVDLLVDLEDADQEVDDLRYDGQYGRRPMTPAKRQAVIRRQATIIDRLVRAMAPGFQDVRTVRRLASVYADKWGPAVAFQLSATRYLFTGYAPS